MEQRSVHPSVLAACAPPAPPGRTPEHPAPNHVLAHISDTHFLPPAAGLLSGVVDSRANLAQLLAAVEHSGLRPQVLLFTGDLADTGDADAYAALRAVVEPVAARVGAQILWAAGNHDDRAALRVGLLDQAGTREPLDYVVMLGDLRIVVLDTTVPGAHHGELETAQLNWLAGVLATSAPDGTLLAMHHPPLPCLQALAVDVELRGQAALGAVLAGTDVRAILAGHLHYSTTGTFAGIPVSVAAATCYTQDLMTPARGTRGRDGGQGLNLVHVYERCVMHTVVPLGVDVTVGEHGQSAAQVTAARAALLVDAGGATALR